MTEHQEICGALLALARDGGATLLSMRAKGFEVRQKPDATPVTTADLACETLLVERLNTLMPRVPVMTEEREASWDLARGASRVLCIDPLDGTREFASGSNEFAVNLALIEKGLPVVGVVFAPALDRAFFSWGLGSAFEERGGARRKLAGSEATHEELTVVASRSHFDTATADLVSRLPQARVVRLGSALKFGLIAAGEADLYPRGSGVKAWDIAAGQAIVEAAGGVVLGLDRKPVRYDFGGGVGIPSFICARTPALAKRLREPA